MSSMDYYVELPEVWITEFLESDPACTGYWISSLTQSWQKGYADNCSLQWSHYVDVVRRLRLHTDKPIMVDVDMLFNEPNIAATIARELYTVGCTTIVVESKRFPKVNSLIPGKLVLSSPDEYCRLLNKVKTTVPKLELIARIEYLATTRSVETTYEISKRAVAAGADGVVVHWGVGSDTGLLKTTLAKLRADGVKTGIIPTKFLSQVVAGEFDKLANFSILGNICSSFIRWTFSDQNVTGLMNTPCKFEPILDRVDSHKPQGLRTLVVLGAKANETGNMSLAKESVVTRFAEQLQHYYTIILVMDQETPVPDFVQESDQIQVVRVVNSIGEVDSLLAVAGLLNTEYVTVAYADLPEHAFAWLGNPGLTFEGDRFAGILNLNSDVLLDLLRQTGPSYSILDMASRQKITIAVR